MSENSTPITKRKNTMLPVLTVLFLIAYGIMTMLIVEQGNIIETQRLLIKQLFHDSVQLSSLKAQEGRRHPAEKAPAKPYARREAPRVHPRQHEPRVDAPQAPADPQRSTISL